MFTFKPQISESSKELAEKKKKKELSKYLLSGYNNPFLA